MSEDDVGTQATAGGCGGSCHAREEKRWANALRRRPGSREGKEEQENDI